MPLPFYGKWADADFWDAHWEGVDMEAIIKNLESSFLAHVMEKYLPRSGGILDGGCGLGQWVLYLRRKGYDIVGIDFAENTVRRVKECFPDLPMKTGDILDLPYLDSHFLAYISFGVIEHFEEGPTRALAEANRVLKPEGVLLCSVPYFNPIRRMKKRFVSSYHAKVAGDEFYQWAFTRREIVGAMKAAGFMVLRCIPYNAVKGIKDEVPGARMAKSILARDLHRENASEVSGRGTVALSRFLRAVLETCMFRTSCGHMLLVVAEKQVSARSSGGQGELSISAG